MKTTNIILGILISAFVATPEESDATESTTVNGAIKVTSAGRMGRAGLQLKTENKTVHLTADSPALTHELERMNKMNVALTGLFKGKTFEVTGYRLLPNSSGETPVIGQFGGISINGKYRIIFVYPDGEAALLPMGWSKKMRKHVGSKAWMLGEPHNGQLTPKRFGILGKKSKK